MRHQQGMTLVDLSKRTGLKEQYLNRVEMGEHQVTLRNLQVLADGLGVSAAALIDGGRTAGDKEARLAHVEAVLRVVKNALEDV
ncbi:MAG: helix-turn-helix transcriptional regulator [Rhodocyclaceae bacterium]|nr:helix-turn-helix transcriptional regulator [Rhodocyclaceae bacterium]